MVVDVEMQITDVENLENTMGELTRKVMTKSQVEKMVLARLMGVARTTTCPNL